MSGNQRIFADDWRECLGEQYKYVIRQNDQRTKQTLTSVLHEVNFHDHELRALELQATIRAEDMPDDYIPEAVHAQYHGVDLPSQPEADAAPALEAEPLPLQEPEPEPPTPTYEEMSAAVDAIEHEQEETPPQTEDPPPTNDTAAPTDTNDEKPTQLKLF